MKGKNSYIETKFQSIILVMSSLVESNKSILTCLDTKWIFKFYKKNTFSLSEKVDSQAYYTYMFMYSSFPVESIYFSL